MIRRRRAPRSSRRTSRSSARSIRAPTRSAPPATDHGGDEQAFNTDVAMASKKRGSSARNGGKGENGRERGGFKASRHGAGRKADKPQRASAAGPKADQKRAAEERERSGARHTSHESSRFLKGDRIDPRRIDGSERVADLIDGCFLAYSA